MQQFNKLGPSTRLLEVKLRLHSISEHFSMCHEVPICSCPFFSSRRQSHSNNKNQLRLQTSKRFGGDWNTGRRAWRHILRHIDSNSELKQTKTHCMILTHQLTWFNSFAAQYTMA